MTKHVDLRLPNDLAHKIDARAKKVGLSRNAWLVKALEWAIEQPVKAKLVMEEV